MNGTRSAIAVVLLSFAVSGTVYGQARHDEKPHGTPAPSPAMTREMPEDAIALKDGGKLIVNKDGTTYHVDAKGRRARMRDGVMMEAQDGTRYMMKNDALWKAITEKGTLHPNHQ